MGGASVKIAEQSLIMKTTLTTLLSLSKTSYYRKKEMIILQTEVQKTGPNTICLIDAMIGNQYRLFIGAARCHPDDKFDKSIGSALAMSRAMSKVAKAEARWANGLVKQRDHMKAKRAAENVVTAPESEKPVLTLDAWKRAPRAAQREAVVQ